MFRRTTVLHITVFCIIIFNICNAFDLKTLLQRHGHNDSGLVDSKLNSYQKQYRDFQGLVNNNKPNVESTVRKDDLHQRIIKRAIPKSAQDKIITYKNNAVASAVVGSDHSEKKTTRPINSAIVGRDHAGGAGKSDKEDREKRCTDCEEDETKEPSGSLIILPLIAMVAFIVLLVARCCNWTAQDVKELSMIVESPQQRKSLARALLSVQTGADMHHRGSDAGDESKQLLLLPLLLSGLTPQLRRQSMVSPNNRRGSIKSPRGSIRRENSLKPRKWYQKMKSDSLGPVDSDPHPVWGPPPEPIPFLREMSSLSGVTINSGETDSLKLDKDSLSSTPRKKRSKSFHGRSVTIKAECHTIESKDYNDEPSVYTVSTGIDIGVGTESTYFTDDHLPLAKWKHRNRSQANVKKLRKKSDAQRFSAPGLLASRSLRCKDEEEDEPMLNQYTIDNDNVSSNEELDALILSNKRVPYEADFEYILESQKSPCISFSDSISLDDVFGPPSPVSSHHSIEDSGYHNHFPRSPLSPVRPPPRDSISDDSAVATSATSSTTRTDTLKKSHEQTDTKVKCRDCTLNENNDRPNSNNDNNNYTVNGHVMSPQTMQDPNVYFYMSRSDEHLCVSDFQNPPANLCSASDDELRPKPGHSRKGKRPPKLAEICQSRLVDKYSRTQNDETPLETSRESSKQESDISDMIDSNLDPKFPRDVLITIDHSDINPENVLNINQYSDEDVEDKEYMV